MKDTELKEKRKKTVYAFLCDPLYAPMKLKEIATMLSVPREKREALLEVLEELIAEGKVEQTKRGKYCKAEKESITGVFHAHPKGYGFVAIEGENEELFIPAAATGGACHMDTVEVQIFSGTYGKGVSGDQASSGAYGRVSSGNHASSGGSRREGAIVRIIERGMKTLVCTYESSGTYGFAVPDQQRFGSDIFIPAEHSKGAVTGHKVVVEITDYGKGKRNPEGKVIEILGHINDPGTDILSIARAYGLPMEFSEKIMNQVERVAKAVSEADMAGRLDLRETCMVTIDGEDAKDLDDAVSVERDGANYVLGVHIADVTNYVQEHSALDVEALKRGTSVYLVDRVIPMLPHALSNGICSLNQGENRLALSCIMTIDPTGKVVDHKIAETVICVNRRMTYTGVKKLLEFSEITDDGARASEIEKAGLVAEAEYLPMFLEMRDLAAILRKKRMQRGSIDFDFPETKVKLDADGTPVEIKPYERNVATKIIEDFMLIANETVASDYFWLQLPFVYRTHENPDAEKIRRLGTFIHNFGYHIRIGQDEIHPKELQKLLENIDGTPEEALIARLTLRSMKQARYTTYDTGHFGLAAEHYCHFTSPIRRYPDLQIHRIIKENLRGRLQENRVEHYDKILPEVAKHSSETERRAEEAERETVKLKKAQYMEKHLGEEFEGVISGVTEWGFFVELPNTVEGLVRVAAMKDDFYRYSEETYELIGERSGRRYKLGQRIRVQAVACDRVTRTVDFEIADEGETDGSRSKKTDCE